MLNQKPKHFVVVTKDGTTVNLHPDIALLPEERRPKSIDGLVFLSAELYLQELREMKAKGVY